MSNSHPNSHPKSCDFWMKAPCNCVEMLGRTEAGDECPLCECGTVEIVGDLVESTFNRETRCRGECGAVAPTHPSVEAGPGCLLPTADRPEFTPDDLRTVRNLVVAFEEHLKQESHRLDVPVETLCPCSGDEVKAARELLYRLDPLMVL